MPAAFLLLSGCRLFSASHDLTYPQASLSADWNQLTELGAIDVGTEKTVTVMLSNPGALDLGVWEIALQTGDDFSVAYDLDEASCKQGGAGASEQEEGFLLHSECTLPLHITFRPTTGGDRYDSLEVVTFEDDASPPAFFADQRDPIEHLAITGYGQEGELSLEPRSLSFGHVATGETASALISVKNVGDGPLQISALELDCGAMYSLNTSQYSDELQAGESTLLEVLYTPMSSSSSQCLLYLSDDSEETQQVFLQGNLHTMSNTPPSLTLIGPEVGHFHDGTQTLEFELQMMDPDQDPTTLECIIKSTWQDAGVIADCTPTDETGHLIVSIEGDALEAGVDTLEVIVRDAAEAVVRASTTVSWWTTSADDDDGDGFGNDSDCDDNEASSYPGAIEQWDGVDNDCDGEIDEETEGVDDDGDLLSGADGDCNDSDPDVYPGAPELSDLQDNDCDGQTDEGTALVDEDGDGYSPSLGDCNDTNDAIHPGADELCDGVDNDCDAQIDSDDSDGCLQADAAPEIIACLHEDSALSRGERVVMAVSVVDEDISPAITWSLDDALGTLTNPTGKTTAWIAPDSLSSAQETVTVTVTVTDSQGQSDTCSDTLTVYAAPLTEAAEEEEVRRADGCSGGAAAVLLPLSLLGLRRRRPAASTDTTSLRNL